MNSSEWSYWINEPVFLDKGVTNIVKRKEAIYHFVSEGLFPLLQKAGYALYYSKTETTSILLKLLFTIRQGKKVQPLARNDGISEEHLEYFEFVLGWEEWTDFWLIWGTLQDFDIGGCGHEFRMRLPLFLWSWLSLEISPAAIKLQEQLDEAETMEDFPKGKEDIYLQENSKRDYTDKHWH